MHSQEISPGFTVKFCRHGWLCELLQPSQLRSKRTVGKTDLCHCGSCHTITGWQRRKRLAFFQEFMHSLSKHKQSDESKTSCRTESADKKTGVKWCPPKTSEGPNDPVPCTLGLHLEASHTTVALCPPGCLKLLWDTTAAADLTSIPDTTDAQFFRRQRLNRNLKP